MVHSGMEVSITQFRRQFSPLSPSARAAARCGDAQGPPYQNRPEGQPASGLSRITPMEIMVDPNFDMNDRLSRLIGWPRWRRSGRRIGPTFDCYLDTHIFLWLAAGKVNRLSSKARGLLDRADLLFTCNGVPRTRIPLRTWRTKFHARDLMEKVGHETNLRLCDLPLRRLATPPSTKIGPAIRLTV